MQLKFIEYVEFPKTDREWRLEGTALSQINLVVGKNATGKTRMLNLIASLAKLITGEIKEIFQAGSYVAKFQKDGTSWEYLLEYDNAVVTREELLLDGTDMLHRGEGSIGRIVAEDIENKPRIRFQADARQVAVLSKRDAVQHGFLEPLHDWALSVRHFRFGGDMGNLAVAVKGPEIEINDRDTSQLVPILHKALKKYGETFKESVKADMAAIGYPLDDLQIRRPPNTIVHSLVPAELVGVAAKETELKSATDQNFMSSGMFRALSLLIQTTYFSLENSGGCFLIDDIGDGLDFERACGLIDLLRDKAQKSSIQLIMSTNNRFIMNRIPLEHWCVLHRKGSLVQGWNDSNSHDAFERFKITGLNNFDMLATGFLNRMKGDG